MNQTPQQATQQKNGKTVRWMFLVVVGMFCFGFALVPLYDMFCSVTGLNNGKTGRIQEEQLLASHVDFNRTITVEFDATNNAELPWDFYPMVKEVQVHPGEIKEVSYFVKNNSDKAIVAQAIPGITPWQATSHFNKTECFCFTKQKLEAGESKEMALRFVVNAELPEELNTITLSYTFMDTDRTKSKKANNFPDLHSTVKLEKPYNNI
jgi:cytochrome c oxidase assembly protein subunit 11